MKKILSLALVFVLLLGALSSYAAEGENDERVKSMVVVGDFNSAVIEPPSEEPSDAETEAPEKQLTFADLAAEKLGLKYGETYFNYSKNEMTAESLLAYLGGELSEAESKSFNDASVVVLSVGMNDFTATLLPKIAAALGLDANATPKAVATALAKTEEKDLENALSEIKLIYEKNETEISAMIAKYRESLSASVKKIKELSPNAQILVVNAVDPFADLSQYALVKTLRATLTSDIVSDMNEALSESGKSEDFYVVDAFGEFKGRKSPCISAEDDAFRLTELGSSILADTLVYRINTVYDEIYDNDGGIFKDPEDVWIWFTFAVAVVVIAVPIVNFVAKKSKK